MLAALAVAVLLSPPREIIAQIAKQFERHPVVMVGETHRYGELHAFLQQLLRDPAFICRVDDVVVEFGNSRLQPLADAYANGAALSEAQVLSLLRETAVPLTWNSPLYRQFYETVRDVNRKRVCPHPIRIVLADPPLDWSKIHSAHDYVPWDDRDGSQAAVVEREVLAKGHRAFFLAGEAHAVKRSQAVPGARPGDEDPSAAELIERKHPGALLTIVAVPARSAEALHMGPPPSFRIVHGSELEQADFGLIWKGETTKRWPPMGEVVDALLFVGKETLVYPPPSIYLDPAYLRELRRRATILKEYSGQDFLPVIDDLVQKARSTR